jgi:hypothetical protein
MEQTYAVIGTVENGRVIHLDTPILLAAHRVRVTLEPILPDLCTGDKVIDHIKKLRANLERSGFRFRSKEEIDRQIQEERDTWGD